MTVWEETILLYVAAWNESNEEKRRTLLEQCWAENGSYTDPKSTVEGREALVQHIGTIFQRSPTDQVLLTSGIDEHHGYLRFTWARVNAQRQQISNGIDFGELEAEGRLIRIMGFFGPPQPIPSSFPVHLIQTNG